jgi:uncharacterized membrane protein YfcA
LRGETGVILVLVVLGLLIGATLGALGAGGSILAVPVLVHVAGLPAAEATATSLVAVGSAAALGAAGHRRHLRLDVAAWFVPTGFVGALLGARVGRQLDDTTLLLAFSVLMMIAAVRMLAVKDRSPRSLSAATAARDARNRRPTSPGTAHEPTAGRRGGTVVAIAVAGAVVGFLTGLFGVGGGFVIVPALTLALGLAMPEAIATSLVIVAANAVIALTVRGAGAVDWPIAVALTLPMLVASVIGARFARRLPAERTRLAFAGLLIAVAALNAVAVAV